MAKINWNRPKKIYDGIGPESFKKIAPLKVDHIPEEHLGHELKAIRTIQQPPHYGKLVCATCNNKYIKWLNKTNYTLY